MIPIILLIALTFITTIFYFWLRGLIAEKNKLALIFVAMLVLLIGCFAISYICFTYNLWWYLVGIGMWSLLLNTK